MLREVESLVKPRTGRSVNISHYAQLGFLGGKLGFVSQGHVAARLLMQHCEEHGMSEDAEVPDWNEEEFSPQYDLWRMSRFLLTEDFTRIQHVLMQVGGIIQTPLLQVCMTYPERISLQLESAIGCNAGVEGRYYLNGVSLSEMHEVIGLKFLLSADEIAQHLKQTNSPLQRLTDDELRAERAKLKELPPLRRNKIRRSIVREEFRRRFPHGNVFLNPDVVAFHLYDMMSPGVWADNCYLREKLLPDGGKGSMHVGVDFFDMFPHLFITQGVTTTTVNVMRREQGMEDIVGDGETWKSAPFREEDILFALLPWLMKKTDDFKDFKHLEFLLSFTPRHMFKRLQMKGSAVDLMANMLQKYPESFEVVSVNDGKGGSRWMVRVFRDGVEKLGTRLLNAAQTSQDESDKLAVADATPVLDEEPSQEKVC
uniref:Uncharacterized protein TCIL3000_9_5040 n=1 Tax=Trypanosoma congolense (strain IL3000) TaxID=1068625 RepID=G0UUN4_TRYCI|nr:unnamed protein product [Trypanosoma congolense IL3000]